MLVFVSMCPGDLASASVLAAIARPPYYYVINAFHSFIFLQTVQCLWCINKIVLYSSSLLKTCCRVCLKPNTTYIILYLLQKYNLIYVVFLT